MAGPQKQRVTVIKKGWGRWGLNKDGLREVGSDIDEQTDKMFPTGQLWVTPTWQALSEMPGQTLK